MLHVPAPTGLYPTGTPVRITNPAAAHYGATGMVATTNAPTGTYDVAFPTGRTVVYLDEDVEAQA